jgi:FPC/CPF motif-containing protein YcgG
MQPLNYDITNASVSSGGPEMESTDVVKAYFAFLNHKPFPCIGAKAALAGDHIKCFVADHMACPKDDQAILQFLYDFVDEYRKSDESFYSAAVFFKDPKRLNEEIFDALLWERLQALSDLDAANHGYDKRVNTDPASRQFSFSIKEEAFYIIGLHPASSRRSRQFAYPAFIFNPHAQFEKLKETNKYDFIRNAVRKRDLAYSGSVNPMLEDFGKSSEVRQYSGRAYDALWQCPLNIKHQENDDHPST